MKRKEQKGITLIALIITIIIMLILVVVSVLLVINSGLIDRTREAGETTTQAYRNEEHYGEKIRIGETDYNSINEYIDKINTENGNNAEEDNDGENDSNLVSIDDISNYLKVGDYVSYDPLHTDLEGNVAVEQSKLQYTSPTGTGQSHGNGYESSEEGGGQTFTAQAGIYWRVLSISPKIVKLVSENPIKKDNISDHSGNFVLKGAIGYLYAEQELNEICKIYGYGYGAYTDQVLTYKICGPFDFDSNGKNLTGRILNSGARSIKIDDINKIAKVGEIADGENITSSYNSLNNNYGISVNYPANYFPTNNTSSGISDSKIAYNLINTSYMYEKNLISDTTIQNMLFSQQNYWLAGRRLTVTGSRIEFVLQFLCR